MWCLIAKRLNTTQVSISLQQLQLEVGGEFVQQETKTVKGLKRFVTGIDALSEWTGRILAFTVIAMMGVLVFEVVSRYAFDSPTNWAGELTQMMFGGYFMLVGAYVLRWKAHVSMDLLYRRWSPRMQAIVDLVTSLLFFFFCIGLVYYGWQHAWFSLQVTEHSHSAWRPPVYPLRMCIPVGAFLILLQGMAKLIRDGNMAIRGKEL